MSEQLLLNKPTEIFDFRYVRSIGMTHFFECNGPFYFSLGFDAKTVEEANQKAKSIHDAVNKAWVDPRITKEIIIP
jgi:hypothetical protein